MTPALLFRRVAVAEAITWALLLTGMFLKYVTETTELGVRVFGMLHGVVFVAYGVVTLVVAVDQRWRPGRTLVALACAVPPFATVPFDRWLERRHPLADSWRLRATDPAGPGSAHLLTARRSRCERRLSCAGPCAACARRACSRRRRPPCRSAPASP